MAKYLFSLVISSIFLKHYNINQDIIGNNIEYATNHTPKVDISITFNIIFEAPLLNI